MQLSICTFFPDQQMIPGQKLPQAPGSESCLLLDFGLLIPHYMVSYLTPNNYFMEVQYTCKSLHIISMEYDKIS